MYELICSSHFDSAHHLVGYAGKCQFPHGHTFLYRVAIQGDKLDKLGILIDFTVIKEAMRTYIDDQLDHQDLNLVGPFGARNPTAENLARFIFQTLQLALLSVEDIRVAWVEVWESEKCGVRYWE